jgi:hypothetical protein
MLKKHGSMVALVAILAVAPASANVVTDWDEIAVKALQPSIAAPALNPGLLYRAMAMAQVAMFNAANCVEPRYQGYKMQVELSPDTSMDAAVASAAANVLMKVIPVNTVQPILNDYLAKIPNGPAKDRGIKLGEDLADNIIKMREDDGSKTRNAFRPITQPGVYTVTAFTIGWEASSMRPFVMTSPSQFRPGPPPDLKSDTWAKDYNEIKELGERNSIKRSARQTEDARFWLATGPAAYHPFVRQIAIAKNLPVVDSARFMALVSLAEADSIQAVYEAKWHYMFWRPMTAIRNGDIDDNPATERDATWEPIDVTPLHPEYPCAHCVGSEAVAAIIKATIGPGIPEVAISSPSAPGVTHHYASLDAFTDEVANARIYAGFHYRYSTVVGRAMGKQVGEYIAATVMRPSQ